MDERTDAELIRAYADGDEGAFETLVLRYVGPIYRFSFRLVRDAHNAEDLTQETFIKVWKNLSRFDPSKSFKAWIFAIARNTAIDAIRKKDPITFSAMERDDDGAESGRLQIDVEDPRPLPDEIAARAEDAGIIDAMLDTLPPKQRSVILLHDGEELTFQEIADAAKEPLNTVKSRYRRGVEALKNKLSSGEEGAPMDK
jgi:RNA polymerase sigma-70 factor, ECF subfamily